MQEAHPGIIELPAELAPVLHQYLQEFVQLGWPHRDQYYRRRSTGIWEAVS